MVWYSELNWDMVSGLWYTHTLNFGSLLILKVQRTTMSFKTCFGDLGEVVASTQDPNQDLKDMDVLCTFKTNLWRKIRNIGVSKTSDHILIKIKMPKPSQEPPASSKAPGEDLKDMVVLCTFKIKRERDQIWYKGFSKTSDNIQIKIKMLNPSQESPASSKYLNQD